MPASATWTSKIPDLVEQQLPYAMSVALNETAKAFQTAQRAGMRQRMRIRRAGFADRAVKITEFAKKTTLRATVAISGPGSDIFAQLEDNRIKRPTQGGRSIAIPLAARTSQSAIIPKGQRPRALLENTKKNFILEDHGERFLVQHQGRGKKAGLRFLYALRPSAAVRQRLGFHATARQVIARELPKQVQFGMAKALSSARLASGTRNIVSSNVR